MTFIISSITPVTIFLYLIYQRDHFKEPFKLLLKCFVGGFLVFVLAFLAEIALDHSEGFAKRCFTSSFYSAFFQAALCEEGFKFLVLNWIVWRSKELNEEYDGIVYSVFVSMGMALLENLCYVYNYGIKVAVIRGVLSVPAHGFFAVQMGYFLAKAKFGSHDRMKINLLKSFTVPFFFHGAFDFCLMSANNASSVDNSKLSLITILFTSLVILLWRLGFKDIQKLSKYK